MSRHFAMLMPSPLAMPAAGAEAEDEESRLQAGLASRILSGRGLGLDWLEEIDRRGLVEELLAEGIVNRAVATAPHSHQLDRALNAKTTLMYVLAGCLFPRRGPRRDLAHYLRHARPGPQARHPGPHRPGAVAGQALPGEQVARPAFELDARADVDRGIGATWHDMETTTFHGTTAELFSNDVLAGSSACLRAA